MRNFIHQVFNWKKNPGGVFYIAAPLAILGFVLLFLQAFIQYKVNDDIGYLVIFGLGIALFTFAMYPVYKHYKIWYKPKTKNN